jgi:hypothetical protein
MNLMNTHDTLPTRRRWSIATALTIAFAAICASAFAQKAPANLPAPGTETMHSVAHVKRGMEGRYAELSAQAWALYRKLDLVLERPHVVLRGVDEAGLPYFVEVFTWKSADVPDHAPPEVLAIWKQLEEACEKRAGRPGIDFAEVTAVALD